MAHGAVRKRNYRHEYDSYHKKPEQKIRRAQRNHARRKMTKLGAVCKGDGMDVDHKDHNTGNNGDKNLQVLTASENRRFNNKKRSRRL